MDWDKNGDKETF